MALSKEELAELAALEKEEQDTAAKEADDAARQRLEAKRMRKRLAAKHGKHGVDGLDTEGSEGQERAMLENFVLGLLIEPSKEEVQKCLAEYCGVVTAIANYAKRMTGSAREEDAKK
jgi:hypothetical protein